jgi:hypothetical protein
MMVGRRDRWLLVLVVACYMVVAVGLMVCGAVWLVEIVA